MGKSKILMGALALALGIGIPLTATAPAFAEEGTWTFVTPNGAVVPIQTAEDGTQFWDVQIQGSGNFVATWERRQGYWNSTGPGIQAANNKRDCQIQVTENYFRRFSSWEDWNSSPTTGHNPDGTTWSIVGDPESDAAYAACNDASEYTAVQVKMTLNKETGIYTVQIPVTLLGSGTHNLFIQNLEMPDDRYDPSLCRVINQAEFGWTGDLATAGCRYTPGAFERISVNVEYPMANAGHVIAGPEVSEKTWFDQGVYSDLKPANWDFFGNFKKFSGPAVVTLGVTSVFAVLIALPTSLLESSLEANQSRVENMLKRLIPGYGRRKKEPVGDAQNPGSDEGKS